MNTEVEVSNLMFNKSNEDKINFKKYDINVDLEEKSSNEEKTVLKYSLDLTSNPKNSVINISGNTILSGEPEEIEEFLKQEDAKTPEIVSMIYQELFPLMYIISKNMNIPSPAHTLSQNNVSNFEESDVSLENLSTKKIDSEPNQVDNNPPETTTSSNEHSQSEIKTNTTPNEQEELEDEKEV